MQPYYIHTAKTDTTEHPSERHAHNTNKASQIPRTPLRYTTHMETAY